LKFKQDAMNLESFQNYCLSKKGVEATFPFDEVTLVFKVMGKMFAISGLDNPDFAITLKCDPDRAEELREVHQEIRPAWHMSKKHWNSVDCEGDLRDELIRQLIDHSYDLVVAGLPRKLRIELEQLE
jgi:predicted DNA-binding protein (MmcQ/YjbR family)